MQAIYFSFPDRKGWSNVFQVDWFPLPGANAQLSLLYRQDDPLTGLKRKLRSVRLRWDLNRRTFVDFSVDRQRIEDPLMPIASTTAVRAFLQSRF